MRKLFLLSVAIFAITALWAYDFKSDDLYYNITSNVSPYTVEVTCAEEWGENNYAELSVVTIPESVTYEGITYQVTAIGEAAFAMCSSITSITIPNCITTIEDYSLCYTSISSLVIPDNVISMGVGVCVGNEKLTSAQIGKGVQELNSAFQECFSLTTITLAEGLQTIGESTFNYCISLMHVNIPSTVTTIGRGAFRQCAEISTITIPQGVTQIGDKAFDKCFMAKENFINNSALDEEANNYWGCSFFDKEVDGLMIIGDTLIKCRGYVTDANIPDNIVRIKEDAFNPSTYSSLKTVTIPNSVTYIGKYAFANCDKLTQVICKAVNVPQMGVGENMYENVFASTPIENAALYVPQESLDLYKSAEQWKEFGQILPIEQTPNILENTIINDKANTQKFLHNGQLIIVRDGKTYNAMGQEM